MFHVIDLAQDNYGNAMPFWQVEIYNLNTDAVVATFADYDGTIPIETVSLIENRAVSDQYGNVSFFVAPGTYGKRYYNAEGVWQRSVTGLDMYGADNAAAAEASAVAAAASAVASAASAVASDASADASAASAVASDASADASAVSAAEAVVSAATAAAEAANAAASADQAIETATQSQGFVNMLSIPAAALPYEVTAVSGGVGTGTGGTNGTYNIDVTGGPPGFKATVTIAGGTIASYAIVNPGIASVNTAPTLSLAGVTGLTGETPPTATVGTVPVNRVFTAPDAAGEQELAWINSAGSLAVYPVGGPQFARYLKEGVDAAVASISDIPAAIGMTEAATASTLGYLTGASNVSSNVYLMGNVIAEPSIVDSVTMEFSNTASIELYLVHGLSRVVVAKATETAATGTNVFLVPFGPVVMDAGLYLAHVVSSGVGRCKYDAAGSGSTFRVTQTTYNVGDTLPAFTAEAAAFTLNCQMALTTVSDAHTPRIETFERAETQQQRPAFGEVQDWTTYSVGSFGLARSGDESSNWVIGLPIMGDCIVQSVDISFNGAASGFVEGFRYVNGATVLAYRKFVNYTGGAGDVNVALSDWSINAGGYVTYRRLAGLHATYNLNGGTMYFVAAPAYYDFGGTITLAPFAGTQQPNFRANVRLPKRRSYRATRNTISGPNVVEAQTFPSTTTPTGWTIAAPFSVSDGLLASGAGAPDKNAYWGGTSAVSKRKLMGRILLNDVTTTIHGISTKPNTTTGGIAALIDCVAGKLRLYSWAGSTVLGTMLAETTFGAALVAGRYYSLTLERNEWVITAVLTDCVTGTTTTVTNTSSTSGAGRVQGRPGVMHIAGDVKWDWIRFAHRRPRMVRALAIGDSNTEGTLLSGGKSWFQQLDDTYGNMVNASYHGDTSAGAVVRMSDITDHRAAHVFLGMGSNETTLATWRLNTRTLIDAVVMTGGEPILVIPPPYVAKQALITSISGDITGNYFGRYRYVDLLGALSNANDRLTWNATYDSGDGVHLNAAGQTRAMAQALADVPDVFA